MDEKLKSNLTSSKHWSRLVYMILFAVFLYVAAFVVSVLVVVQFLFALITGSDNHKLRDLGYSVSTYIHQALQFLTYNSELKPFPFADWPSAPPRHDIDTTAKEPAPQPEPAPQASTASEPVSSATASDQPTAAESSARGASNEDTTATDVDQKHPS